MQAHAQELDQGTFLTIDDVSASVRVLPLR
jgi:hypothetical protein